jgi:thiosulfate/3-mercaptopyruvate sulfurtransferase
MPSDKQKYWAIHMSKIKWKFFLLALSLLMLMAPHLLWAFDLQRMEAPQAAVKINELIVLDARPQKECQQGHIPGAISFCWENYTQTDATGVQWRIFPPEELAKALGALGVSHTNAVLVYGDADTSWGGEGWLVWSLAWLGHQGPVYFLDGGIQSWRESKQPVTSDTSPERSPVEYQVKLQPQVNITAKQLAENSGQFTIIDTRKYLTEWLPGHIPGAIHIPWEKFYQGPNRRIISPEALKLLLQQNGVDLKKQVVYYCSGGIRSGFAWLAHQLSGMSEAINYEGGTEEWSKEQPLVR